MQYAKSNMNQIISDLQLTPLTKVNSRLEQCAHGNLSSTNTYKEIPCPCRTLLETCHLMLKFPCSGHSDIGRHYVEAASSDTFV